MGQDDIRKHSTVNYITKLVPTLGWNCIEVNDSEVLRLETALAKKEAQVKKMKELALEDGDYYHCLQVRLSNLE